jgi:hypothetical protein
MKENPKSDGPTRTEAQRGRLAQEKLDPLALSGLPLGGINLSRRVEEQIMPFLACGN